MIQSEVRIDKETLERFAVLMAPSLMKAEEAGMSAMQIVVCLAEMLGSMSAFLDVVMSDAALDGVPGLRHGYERMQSHNTEGMTIQ